MPNQQRKGIFLAYKLMAASSCFIKCCICTLILHGEFQCMGGHWPQTSPTFLRQI